MSKRITCMTMVLLLLFSSAVLSQEAVPPDILNTGIEEEVKYLLERNIMSGFPDGTFKPGEEITRAQFATIAVKCSGFAEEAASSMGETGFVDVPGDHWASGYINTATRKNFIQGYGDDSFGPEDSLTYAQAITILVRLLGMGEEVEKQGLWPTNYIEAAKRTGILNKVNANAANICTRGDAALMLYNTVRLMEGRAEQDTPEQDMSAPIIHDMGVLTSADVKDIRFFTGDDSFNASEDRVYSVTRSFKKADSGNLNTEFSIKHPQIEQRANFPLELRFVNNDEDFTGSFDIYVLIEPDTTETYKEVNLPWEELNRWPDGNYTLEMRAGNMRIGFRTLTLYTDYTDEINFIKEAEVLYKQVYGTEIVDGEATGNYEYGNSFKYGDYNCFALEIKIAYDDPGQDIYLPVTFRFYDSNDKLMNEYAREEYIFEGTREKIISGGMYWIAYKDLKEKQWPKGRYKIRIYAYADVLNAEEILLAEESFRVN